MRADELAALWKRIGDAGFLSDDEKRAAVGYGTKGGGVERRYNPNHDERGRFASGATDHAPGSNRDGDPESGINQVAANYGGPSGVLINQFEMSGFFRCIYDFGFARVVTDYPARVGACPPALNYQHPSIQTGDVLNDNFR